MDLLIDIIGWVGAGLMLIAYGLVSASKLRGDGLTYQTMNLIGAVALMINTAYLSAWPSATLNLVWMGIGAVTVGKLVAARGKNIHDTTLERV
ncbi:CBU_0592 family membrane protein [Sinosporangium siamense]|uniref:CBU-0592-like domain-containing protein n=1 Tax=Sinosporangium siamense TaxID=1367973 RepID=A0A919V9F8_9ACTN|nr:hypothetical protein [Sinosporangium siamense]GII90094.1 hypothetical protein Ssi02_03250 [Sinosporangium siamense]